MDRGYRGNSRICRWRTSEVYKQKIAVMAAGSIERVFTKDKDRSQLLCLIGSFHIVQIAHLSSRMTCFSFGKKCSSKPVFLFFTLVYLQWSIGHCATHSIIILLSSLSVQNKRTQKCQINDKIKYLFWWFNQNRHSRMSCHLLYYTRDFLFILPCKSLGFYLFIFLSLRWC